MKPIAIEEMTVSIESKEKLKTWHQAYELNSSWYNGSLSNFPICEFFSQSILYLKEGAIKGSLLSNFFR